MNDLCVRTLLQMLKSEIGTQRHSPSTPGASPLLGVERSDFIWARPGRISTARDPRSCPELLRCSMCLRSAMRPPAGVFEHSLFKKAADVVQRRCWN